MVGFGVLNLLQRPGPPGLAAIAAFGLLYVLRPWLDKLAKRRWPRRAPRDRAPPAP